MSNFSPKLEDTTDQELKHSINEFDPRYGSLASDELTRRALLKLQQSIEKFDLATSNYTRKLITLTVLLFFVAAIQLVVTALGLPFDLLNRGLIAVSIVLILAWIIRDMTRD
jgi:hypothetical protein